ncbi:hypothetical protein BYT27DRAFT_7079221 [Phlegmacium glaucopus]|nr:hypothetical protein BYT27DRAFT_7079221 [Phlegmacium glaucopus]
MSHASCRLQTRGSSPPKLYIRYTTHHRQFTPFPDDTRGFLYYKGPKPGHPDIAGSLRFRIISGSGPDCFSNGVDLRLPTGGVWEIHLYTIVRVERYVGLLLKLLEEGLVSDSAVKKLQKLPHTLLHGMQQILYKLEDPFVARLHGVESLVCMTQENVGVGQIMPLFFDARRSIKMHPYEGFVLARFERSTLAEHANTRTVFLRVLEEISPIRCILPEYDSYIAMPMPGRLLSGAYIKGKQPHRPWNANLDKGRGKAAKMISLLWPRDLNGEDSNSTI